MNFQLSFHDEEGVWSVFKQTPYTSGARLPLLSTFAVVCFSAVE